MPLDLPPQLYLPPKPAIILPADRELLRPLMPHAALRQANFLPGMFPMLKTPAGSSKSFSLLASASDTSDSTPDIPGAIAAGDLCIIASAATKNDVTTAPTLVTPSGFTLLQNTSATSTQDDDGGFRMALFAKILAGSETSVSAMNDHERGWIAAVFRPSGGTLTGFAWNDGDGECVGGNSTTQVASDTISASGETNLPIIQLCFMAMGDINGATSVTEEHSPAMSVIEASGMSLLYRIETASPQNTVVDFDQSSRSSSANPYFAGIQDGYLDFTWA